MKRFLLVVMLLAVGTLSACASNPNDLKKSPCACFDKTLKG